jgi:hypothetical protein
VFGQEREVRMRAEWYDEIRTPLLTSLILCDTGKDDLKERIKGIHQLMVERAMSLDAGQGVLSEEEKFMNLCLQNRQKHAKAKLIIMQVVGLILEKRHQIKLKDNPEVVDPNNTTVQQIYRLLSKQMDVDFDLKRGRKGLLGLPEDEEEEMDDFAKDTLSPREQMELIMKQVMGEYEQRFKLGLNEMKQNVVNDLKEMQQSTATQLDQKCEGIQEYVTQLHSVQLKDAEKFDSVEEQIVKIAKETLSKMQVICNVEQDYQRMVKNMHKLSGLITKLSDPN